jgi:hypothetical protein
MKTYHNTSKHIAMPKSLVYTTAIKISHAKNSQQLTYSPGKTIIFSMLIFASWDFFSNHKF